MLILLAVLPHKYRIHPPLSVRWHHFVSDTDFRAAQDYSLIVCAYVPILLSCCTPVILHMPPYFSHASAGVVSQTNHPSLRRRGSSRYQLHWTIFRTLRALVTTKLSLCRSRAYGLQLVTDLYPRSYLFLHIPLFARCCVFTTTLWITVYYY